MTGRFDIAIVGGGLVGASLAYGMRALGPRLALLDAAEEATPSRGNFGLVWVQGKGDGLAPYGSWTQASAREWPRLAAELRDATGIDVALQQTGGLHVCHSSRELDVRAQTFARLFAQPGFERYDVEMLDRAAIARRLPGLGPDVAGGSFCALDGHCDPLRLLRALRAAAVGAGVAARSPCRAEAITPLDTGFRIATPAGAIEADRVVIAAGLASAGLARGIGIDVPLKPNRGQLLALERVAPFLPFALETIRQTAEGTVLVGDSQQDASDDAVELPVLATMARRAVQVFPALGRVRVIRAWAALRVMSPDGFPVYAESTRHRGAFVVACHSGVTLAAAHAYALAPAILGGPPLPAGFAPFSAARFDRVRAAA